MSHPRDKNDSSITTTMLIPNLPLLFLALTLPVLSSVVILPGSAPKPLQPNPRPFVTSATDFPTILRNSTPNEFPSPAVQIIVSSYNNTLSRGASAPSDARTITPSSGSFIRGAIQAWGEHLHLEIRPDEVWFTILAQLNFYMESHAEAVRDLFVAHQGKEVIYIEDTTWTRVLLRFKDEINDRVKTKWLRDWIVPDFSTTTEDDVMTANILMMGLMKAYFEYVGGIICGLPSVTLLGEKEDWEKLLRRLERLSEFGAEADQYRARLTPILKRFVRSFDIPDAEEIRMFWNQIVFARTNSLCGAAPVELSGWITGFLFWDAEGKQWGDRSQVMLKMDGIDYWMQDIRELPVGYARAPFIMRDFGGQEEFQAYVAAGTLGKHMVEGSPEGYAAALERAGKSTKGADDPSLHGTLRPLSAWMLYGPLDHDAEHPTMHYDAEISTILGRNNHWDCRAKL